MYFVVLVTHCCYAVVPLCDTCPSLLLCCCVHSCGCHVLESGPSSRSPQPLYPLVLVSLALCGLPMCYVTFLGPEATVPWHNSFHSLTVVCFGQFWGLQAAAAGFSPGEHPAEPRTSIREPFLRSALQSLLVIDALSDLALIRSFLVEGCSQWLVWLNSWYNIVKNDT